MRVKLFFSIACLIALSASFCEAAQGGGKKRRKNDPKNDPSVFYWSDSLDDAEEESSLENRPVMLVISKSYGADDYKLVSKMQTWPSAITGSHKEFAAVRGTIDNKDYKPLCEKMKVKTLPVIFWLDGWGNPMSMQGFPDTASQLAGVPSTWPALVAKVDKFYKEHLDRGDRYLKSNKLKEGYKEYALVAPFKGPQPDKARENQKKVKGQWNKLLNIAKAAPPKERTVILQGVARETNGTDAEAEMLIAITDAMNAAGDKIAIPIPVPVPVAVAQESKSETPVTDAPAKTADATTPEPAAAPPAVAETPRPAAPEKAPEEKTLSDLASSSNSISPASTETDDDKVSGLLAGKSDPKLKEAHALVQAGIGSYKKAIADTTDRGPARNAMLKTAYEKLTQAMEIIEASNTAKPDAQLDKVSQDISMMMYGCLKYQSL